MEHQDRLPHPSQPSALVRGPATRSPQPNCHMWLRHSVRAHPSILLWRHVFPPQIDATLRIRLHGKGILRPREKIDKQGLKIRGR